MDASVQKQELEKAKKYLKDRDFATAVPIFKKLIMLDNAEAQYEFARFYHENPDIPKNMQIAAMLYKRAADNGHIHAQHTYGSFCFVGAGCLVDFGESMRYQKMAAGQGHTDAQLTLANHYSMQMDTDNAMKWYEILAENNNVNSQAEVAYRYMRGYGVPKDMEKAIYWYERAMANGDRKAKEILETQLYPMMSILEEDQ